MEKHTHTHPHTHTQINIKITKKKARFLISSILCHIYRMYRIDFDPLKKIEIENKR